MNSVSTTKMMLIKVGSVGYQPSNVCIDDNVCI